jgi:hypothetical protein
MLPWDDAIQNMDIYQMAWVQSQLEFDRQQVSELQLHQLEYLASFINPQAVAQVQSTRENTRASSGDNFLRAVASLSGSKAAAEVAKISK